MIIFQLIVLLCLGYICYQDMKYRAVYWILFPVLGFAFSSIKYWQMGWTAVLSDTSYTLAFFLMQLVLLWFYFSVKHQKITNITTTYLGLGDILFLVAVAFYLSPANYILFYMVSLVLVLVYAIITLHMESIKDKSIPLAGLQAAFLAVLMVSGFFFPQIRLYEDYWIPEAINHWL